MKFRVLYILLLLIISVGVLSANNSVISDSLKSEYYNSTERNTLSKIVLVEDILRVEANNDTLLKFADILISSSEEEQEYKFRGYYYKGISYKNKGLYEKSLEAFYQGSQIAMHIQCKHCQLASMVAIGDVFSESYNSRDAILYYNKALELARQGNDSIILGSTLLKVGSEYLELTQLEPALNNLTQSLRIFSNTKNEYGKALALGKIGKIYAEKRVFHIAEKNITNALSILENYNDSKTLSIYYRYLAEIYRDKKNMSAALDYSHISLSIASHSNLQPQIRDAYKLLTELYTIQGDLDNAFECQSNYINTRDKINREETIRAMADMQTDYEVAQKQAEVDLLNKQRLAQRYLVVGLFAVLSLTIIFFIFQFIAVQKRKILHKKLVSRKEELQQQRDELEKLNRVKDRFFSIISHDLRGPINVLNGTTLLIRDFINSRNYEELEELTVNMEYSVKKVQNLLDNLLEWAVSQQGEFPYKPEELRMHEVCQNVLNIFVTMAATKSINLTYELKSGAELIYADLNSLMTILRNLISNAIKFTRKNGNVQIFGEKKDGVYIVKISDTGVGIHPDKQEDIFIISDDKSTWGTAKEKGLGIGLSLVHEFVKMNKGEITVDSVYNSGSTFTFTIPQESIPPPSANTSKNIRHLAH